MPRILPVPDHRSYLGDEAVSESPVCGQVPPLVVMQMDDLWLKLRDLAAMEMHRQWKEVIPPGRTEYQVCGREGGHSSLCAAKKSYPPKYSVPDAPSWATLSLLPIII